MSSNVNVWGDVSLHGVVHLAKDFTDFPVNPQLGTMVIKGQNLYAYVKVGTLTTWYPLSAQTKFYIHTQALPASTWTVNHNFGTSDIWFTIKDSSGNTINAASTTIDSNSFQINFTTPIVGTAIVVGPDSIDVPAISTSLISVGNVEITGSGITINGNPVVTSGATGNLAAVATSGLFSDLLSKPTTLAGYGISDATPLSHVSNTDLHLTPSQNSLIDAITASSTEINYLSGTSSPIQTQLNAKQPLDGDLTALAAINTNGLARRIGPDNWVADNSSYLTGNETITILGDATGSGTTAITLTLDNSGVASGTYKSVTVDLKGRVTAGTNPTTLAGFGITDAAPLSHVGTGGSEHAVATTSVAGFLSATDKTKLDTIGSNANVTSVAGKTGVVTLTSTDVGLGNVENKSSATIRSEITSGNVTTALGYTPVNKAGDTAVGSLVLSSNSNITLSGNGEVFGLPLTPTTDGSAASKAYVDAVASGLNWKLSVKAATTANITLSGAQTIDGVSLVAGERVLVKNQTNTADNGIYVVATGAWSRSSDMDSLVPIDEFNGASVLVRQGTLYSNTGWTMISNVSTVGTDPVTFAQFSGAGSGVSSLTGTTNRIDVSSTTGAVTLDISANYTGQTSINTLGTVTSGTWNGTAIGDSFITSTLTNKTLTGSAFNGTIGATTPSTGVFTTVTTPTLTSSGLLAISSSGTNGITFSTLATERFRVNSAGNVLIGTTTDNGVDRVQVNGSLTATNLKEAGTLLTAKYGQLAAANTWAETQTLNKDAIINALTVGAGSGGIFGNAAFGEEALFDNTTGSNNSAFGTWALTNNQTGNGNVSIGSFSLHDNTSGTGNTAVGDGALYGNIAGVHNTASGGYSLSQKSLGSNNVAFGYEAGYRFGPADVSFLTESNDSIFIGHKARPLANSSVNEIVIGKDAVGAGSNTVTIGNSSTTNTILRGAVDAGTSLSEAGVLLTAKYGRLASTNTWTSAQTYNSTATFAGNVAIGSTNLNARLSVVAVGSPTSIPALGAPTAHLAVGNGGAYGTMFGTLNTGVGFIQQQRFDGTALAYALTLQQNGGNLLIGTGTDNAVDKVQINGSITATSLKEAGTLLTAKYGQLATTNAWTQLNTFSHGITAFSTPTATGRLDIQPASDIGGFTAHHIVSNLGSGSHWPIALRTNGIHAMVAHLDGRVSIGTTTNNGVDALQVTGTINASTDLKEAGVLLTSKYGRLASNNTWSAINTYSQPPTISVAGTTGVATSLTIGANGNGGAGRGAKIIMTAPGSSSAVPVVELVGYQDTVSATATAAAFAINVANSSAVLTERLRIANTGNVLIGTATDNGVDKLQVSGRTSILGNGTLGVGVASTVNTKLLLGGTTSGNTTGRGVYVNTTIQSDVTSVFTGVQSQVSTAAASFTLPILYHFTVTNPTIGSGSSVTTQIGYKCDDITGSTNTRALDLEISAGTNKWNIYSQGTANNFLNGRTLFGTITDNGIDRVQINQGATVGGIRINADAGVNPAITQNRGGTTVATYTGSFDGMQLNGSQAIRFDIGGVEQARFLSAGLTIGQTSQTAGNILSARSANPFQTRLQGTAGTAGLLLEDTAVADGSRPFAYISTSAGRLNIGNANRSVGNTTSAANWLSITSTGQIATNNEASPDCVPGGVTISTGASNSFALTLKSTSFTAHPFTTINAADTYFALLPNSSTGGVQVRGLASGTAVSGIRLLALQTGASTSDVGRGNLAIDCRKSDGGTASTVMGDSEVMVSFENNATTKMIIRGDGSITTQGGIKFGTGSVLNSFVSGSWTPVLAGSTTAGTLSASTQVGQYVRVGRLVTCQINLVVTSLTGQAGNLIISGLPFASGAHGVSGPGSIVFARVNGIPYTGMMTGRVTNLGTTIELYSALEGGTDAPINSTVVSGTALIHATVSYYV